MRKNIFNEEYNKKRTMLYLGPEIIKMLDDMAREDYRPSRSNEFEHIIRTEYANRHPNFHADTINPNPNTEAMGVEMGTEREPSGGKVG
jgi:hypothetical protein